MDAMIRYIRGWPNAGKGPYRIEIHLAVVAGRLECVGLLIGHLHGFAFGADSQDYHGAEALKRVPYNAHQPPIPAGLLRDIKLPDLIEDAVRTYPETLEDWAKSDPDQWLVGFQDMPEKARNSLAAIEARPKPVGRKPKTPEHWVEVAAVYTNAYKRQDPPTKAVADHFVVSHSTAAKKVAKARHLGLLPETKRGIPSA
jgi:hypothetical protein